MPTIITRGAVSAQGYGFAGAVCTKDGTLGIFALGALGATCGSTTRNKYTYATCSSTTTTSSVSNSKNGSAAGNGTRGIFAIGYNYSSCSAIDAREKFTYATSTNTTCGVGSASQASQAGSAAGNSTRGIFALGRSSSASVLTTRNKYTYNTCSSTTVNVAAASAGGNLGTAVGNSTRGIFAIGTSTANCSNAGLGTKTTNKYIYASDCSVASSCLNSFSYKRAAAGNCSRGIISTGYINCGCPCGAGPSSGRIKYTYATDVVSATACAAASNYWGAATGNSTRGIFAYGVVSGCSYSAIRNKYTYATDTNTACGVGSASSASAKGAAASWAICVNCGA